VSSRPRSNKTNSFYSSFETLSNRSSEVAAKAEEPDEGPHHRIHDDEGSEQPPVFNRASQNVVAAVMLVRAMPEPSTMEGRRVHGELRDLLETAAVQQAESSASQRHGGFSKLPAAPPR